MKLVTEFTGYIYKKKVNEYTKKDGTPGVSYQLVIDQNDNVDTLNCSKDLFEKVQTGTNTRFNATYDTQYNFLTIYAAVPIK